MATQTTPLLSIPSPSTIHIRRAQLSDHKSIARISTLAFWNDVLFGRLIHPFRHLYPSDNDLYWLRRLRVDYWDYSHAVFVATTTAATTKSTTASNGKEVIIGQAHWSRIADSDSENCAAGWGLAWWDPRRLIKPIVGFFVGWSARIWPNRAADPVDENIVERSYHYLDHVWTRENGRSPSWYLEALAVDPKYQNMGVGRKLVAWGLEQAEKEGICASVIAADGKEKFYQRCGFDTGPVGRAGEGEGNPLDKVPGGDIFFREARWKREGRSQPP